MFGVVPKRERAEMGQVVLVAAVAAAGFALVAALAVYILKPVNDAVKALAMP